MGAGLLRLGTACNSYTARGKLTFPVSFELSLYRVGRIKYGIMFVLALHSIAPESHSQAVQDWRKPRALLLKDRIRTAKSMLRNQ